MSAFHHLLNTTLIVPVLICKLRRISIGQSVVGHQILSDLDGVLAHQILGSDCLSLRYLHCICLTFTSLFHDEHPLNPSIVKISLAEAREFSQRDMFEAYCLMICRNCCCRSQDNSWWRYPLRSDQHAPWKAPKSQAPNSSVNLRHSADGLLSTAAETKTERGMNDWNAKIPHRRGTLVSFKTN